MQKDRESTDTPREAARSMKSKPVIRNLSEIEQSIPNEVRKGQCCFLVGGGISMLSPTNFPSGPQLKNWAIKTLFRLKELRCFRRFLMTHERYQTIVSEMVFQCLNTVFVVRLREL